MNNYQCQISSIQCPMTDDKRRILIAEDNPVSRKLLEKSLKNAGYQVSSAENGREALEILEVRFFPIVITDWMMPEMDGVELCRTIRSRNFPGYIYIIIVTAKDSIDDVIAGLDAGANDYLTKPFNRGELMARLRSGNRILELESALKKANEDIRILSITDPLTGIFNRCYMTQKLPKEIKRVVRYHHPLSVIMCDIDHFKRVNDNYGHDAGDLVLKKFANCIRDAFRNSIDWIARYGGEEFLIVLPETDMEGALSAAERFRDLVSKLIIEINGERIGITASFGVSTFNESSGKRDISVESLIKEADRCLYKAKNEGRNRVVGGG